MTAILSELGYQQTKQKLADLQMRLTMIEQEPAMSQEHRARVVKSYRVMMQQYQREIKLYEARHAGSVTTQQ
jgi:hypothetical protein